MSDFSKLLNRAGAWIQAATTNGLASANAREDAANLLADLSAAGQVVSDNAPEIVTDATKTAADVARLVAEVTIAHTINPADLVVVLIDAGADAAMLRKIFQALTSK